MRVRIGTSQPFEIGPTQTILAAALNSSLNVPHGCNGGNCGACRAFLRSGEIDYPSGIPLGLSASEAGQGLILLCQAHAKSDLAVEILEVRPAAEITVKRLPCRIERAVLLSHDVMGVFLRLPAAEDFGFEAGQYIDILLPGGRRRSYSIASAPVPRANKLLELHVRRVIGGEFSDRLFREDAGNTLLNIEGPLGQFVLRAGTERSLLLVGGGTGIAPLLSMLRQLIDQGTDRPMLLYWGVRGERDLYAAAAIADLMSRSPLLRYVPVLSEPSDSWPGAAGWVHAVVLQDIADIRPFEVYAAGPPAMIVALRNEFAARGLEPLQLRSDSFDYATDVPARQPSSAATRS